MFTTDPEVDWSEFQVIIKLTARTGVKNYPNILQAAKVRVKRDPLRITEGDKVRRDPVSDSYNYKFDRRLVDNLLPRKVNHYIY